MLFFWFFVMLCTLAVLRDYESRRLHARGTAYGACTRPVQLEYG